MPDAHETLMEPDRRHRDLDSIHAAAAAAVTSLFYFRLTAQ